MFDFECAFIWREFLNKRKNIKSILLNSLIILIFIYINKDIFVDKYIVICNILFFSSILYIVDSILNKEDIRNLEIIFALPISINKYIKSKSIYILIKSSITASLILIVEEFFININILQEDKYIFGVLLIIIFCITLINLLSSIAIRFLNKYLIFVIEIIYFFILNITYVIDSTMKMQILILIIMSAVNISINIYLYKNFNNEILFKRSLK